MRTAGGAVVTPDMVLEAEEGRGGAGYRAVGEIKSSFPQHRSAVDQMVSGEGPCRVRTIGMGGVKSPGGAGEAKK